MFTNTLNKRRPYSFAYHHLKFKSIKKLSSLMMAEVLNHILYPITLLFMRDQNKFFENFDTFAVFHHRDTNLKISARF